MFWSADFVKHGFARPLVYNVVCLGVVNADIGSYEAPMKNRAEKTNLRLLQHDLATHKLALLRDRQTDRAVFRTIFRELSTILCCEATRDLPLRGHDGRRIDGQLYRGEVAGEDSIVVLSILRTGLIMEEAFRELVPFAKCGHIGLHHDYDTGRLTNYLTFVPDVPATDLFFVLDGVVGTTQSIRFLIDRLMDAGVTADRIRVVSVTASRTGLDTFYSQSKYKDILIFAVDVEDEVDSRGLPTFSLDQFADRLFGTDSSHIEVVDDQ